MFVGEVEQEYVVCLAIDVLFNGAGLISYKGCENTKMAHPCNNIVPIGFTEVKMRLFSKQEDCSQPPASQQLNKSAKHKLHNDLSINRRNILLVYD